MSGTPLLDTTGLIVCYVVLAILLLSLNLYSNWHWLVKATSNIVVALFFWVSYQSWPSILGWPTATDLPRQFYLHAVTIDEPTTIYLWGTDLDRGLGKTIPRAFSLPYTPRLHDRVDKAVRKIRKGLPVVGQIGMSTMTATQDSSLEQVAAADSDVVFIDAPQSLIPGKN